MRHTRVIAQALMVAAAVSVFSLSAKAQSADGSNSSPYFSYSGNNVGNPYAGVTTSNSSGSSTGSTGATGGGTMSTADQMNLMQNFQAMMQQRQQLMQGQNNMGPLLFNPMNPQQQQSTAPADLGSADDPSSPKYKANKLADEADRQRAESDALKVHNTADSEALMEEPAPPSIEALQHVATTQAALGNNINDDPISKEVALDMRKSAQKEAALSYGARGGLAKRNYEIMESMRGFDSVLDRVFDFRQLLIKAPSGLLIEPPIIKESKDALVITNDGDEAAVADKIFDINKKAKIVSAPRDWRQYLIQSWSEVPPPPRVLWPRTPQEQADWSTWVSQGWDAGIEQADQIFESNVNALVADYNGMVRYRMLLAQDMISAPYAMHEDRGVTGDQNQMRVGDRAVRITGPSQFMTKAELWKPADR